MPTPEGKLRDAVHKRLKETGWFQLNMITTKPSGIPDRLIFKEGRYIWLELKAPGGRIRPLQKIMIAKMKHVNMEVYVIDSMEELENIIK